MKSVTNNIVLFNLNYNALCDLNNNVHYDLNNNVRCDLNNNVRCDLNNNVRCDLNNNVLCDHYHNVLYDLNLQLMSDELSDGDGTAALGEAPAGVGGQVPRERHVHHPQLARQLPHKQSKGSDL
jgi:hypothetical protein